MSGRPVSSDVRIRLLDRPDRRLYVQLYGDEGTMRHIGHPLEEAQARRSFAAACRANQSMPPTARFWVIEEKPMGFPLGLIGLHWNGPTSAELGVVLPPAQQGKGIATAAIRNLLEPAFDTLRIERLHTWHAAGHQLASGLMTSLGFVALREPTQHGGQCWELTASAWRGRKG